MRKVVLLLGVHAHQPIGNFLHVLDDAHIRCYGPFLRVMHSYPEFHFAIHVSGWLLNYLFTHFPQDMELLKEMVRRSQAELFGAGFTEPVLASIPSRDRYGQIVMLSDYLSRRFGQRPQGAWLTERVWESTVVPALWEAGIRYVAVDDYHFLCTGKQASKLNGYYTTEEDGHTLDLFPISEPLRYRLPFAQAPEVVSYLESLADEGGQAAAIYFDDIEKFGIWPETHDWVYKKGWLKQFIEGVLNSPLIQPMRYCDYHAEAATKGIIYLPTASYSEMNEWTLPVPAAHHYADMVEREKREGRWEVSKPLVRGGIWRNFFTRYPESNWMHKRMLALSARYHALPEAAKTPAMLRKLYEAQANDAYWHGLFGGIYLPHLRRAIYNAIVGLEAMVDAVEPRPTCSQCDLDHDGYEELFLQNGMLQAVIQLDGTAAIRELDVYRLAHNFGDTLTRQSEHYHRKVHAGQTHGHDGGGIANPHERLGFRHEIHPEDMVTDDKMRMLFRDAWAEREAMPYVPIHYQLPRSGRMPVVTFAGRLAHSDISKKIALSGSSLNVHYGFKRQPSGLFRVEINLAMPSCDGPGGRFRIGHDVLGGFGQPLDFDSIQNIGLDDEVLGGSLQLSCNVPCAFSSAPHFSVSQSEAGFEKIMQALTLHLTWHLADIGKGLEIQLAIH